MRLIVNGINHEVGAEPTTRLIDVLRDELGLTGTKEGCGIGVCGACTIVVDGVAMSACLLLVGAVADRQLLTVEGLAAGMELHPLQTSFVKEGGLQCGFCTPGQIMAAYALLRESPMPTDEQITEGMIGNLCRCTGYYKIREAIKQAATTVAEAPPVGDEGR